MKSADQEAFAAAVHALASAYRVEVSEELLRSWWILLRDLPTTAVLAGLEGAGRACALFPSPAQVRAHAPKAAPPAPRWLDAPPPVPWTPEQQKEAQALLSRMATQMGERTAQLALDAQKPIRRRRKP